MAKNKLNILTVGNPNCGKTSLFNALTGARQNVGNWPGVTVDKKSGSYTHHPADSQVEAQIVEVTDLPGFYALEQFNNQASLDQSIAIQAILDADEETLLVNIIDATNLERNLYLTLQLRELNHPMVVVINKVDLLAEQSKSLDIETLSERLGCPVYALSAHNTKEVIQFKQWIADKTQNNTLPPLSFSLTYASPIESALKQLYALQDEQTLLKGNRNQLLHFLSTGYQSNLFSSEQQEKAQTIYKELTSQLETDIEIADTRYTFLYKLCQDVRHHEGNKAFYFTEKVDKILLHRFLGVPCFLFIMYLMFMFSINLGGAFIDFFDISFGAIFVDGGHYLLDDLLPDWFVTILTDGIGVGIQTVATFIPVIFFLYLFMSLLESTGYMARAAFILDKLMQKIGLPGKAFVPLIIGFGCNVPSVMATRTLEQENERRLAAAMTPFMSCGARLPVYALFCTAFFPLNAQNIVFSLYLLGILVAILTGLLLSRTLYPVNAIGMVLEMPNYERPTLSYLWFKTYHKLKRFIFGAGKTIVIAITILSFINSLGTDGSFGNQDSEKSVLTIIAKKVTPVLTPMGLTEENWPATVGLITGFFAKEAVVGTLNSLYKQDQSTPTSTMDYSLWSSLSEAVLSIPNNLSDLNFNDPLNIHVDNTVQLDEAAEAQNVDRSIFTNIQSSFASGSVAMAYLIFILLYTPCVAAIGAYSREFGRPFTLFIASWTLFMAYGCSTLFYQATRFSVAPLESASWIFLILLLSLMIILWMKRKNEKRHLTNSLFKSTLDKVNKEIG